MVPNKELQVFNYVETLAPEVRVPKGLLLPVNTHDDRSN